MKMKRWQSLVIIIFFGLLLTVLPLALRYSHGHPLISDVEFYKNVTHPETKNLVFNFLTQSWPPILDSQYILFVSIILGLSSLVLFFFIVEKLLRDEEKSLLSAVVLAFSPLFIYLFTTFNVYTICVPVALLSLFFITRKSFWVVPALILLSALDFLFFVISFFLAMIFLYFEREKELAFWTALLALISTVIFSFVLTGYLTVKIFSASLSSYFILFGMDAGISFFLLCLGVSGFLSLWNRKPSYKYWLFSLIFVFILSLFFASGKIFFNFFLSSLTAVFAVFLLRREWSIVSIRNFTLLLVACGVLFSSTMIIDSIVTADPTVELVDSLKFLGDLPEAKVLSHPKNGFFIEYFSSQKAFVSSTSELPDDIFYSRNLEQVSSFMRENNLRYVLVTPIMRSGQVWGKKDEGLLFLLNYDDSFQKIYFKNMITIWELKE